MNQRLSLLALAILILATPSCFFSRTRVNPSIDPAAYGKLTAGTSSQEDVLRELGAPADIVQLGNRSAWRYEHTRSKTAATWLLVLALRNIDTTQDRVWAFFDEAGLLTHIGATFEGEEAAYKFPFED